MDGVEEFFSVILQRSVSERNVGGLHRRRPVSVAEHRVEGVSEVVGLRAVVLLGHWQQECEDH